MGFTEWNRKVSGSYFWEGSKTYISAFGGGKLLVVHKSDKKRLFGTKIFVAAHNFHLSPLPLKHFCRLLLRTYLMMAADIYSPRIPRPFSQHNFNYGEKERDRNFPDGRRGEKGEPLKMEKNPPRLKCATSSVFSTLEEAFFSRPTSFCFSLGNRCQPLSLLFARMRLRRRLERLFYGRLSFFSTCAFFIWENARRRRRKNSQFASKLHRVRMRGGEVGCIRTQHTCSPLPPPPPTSNRHKFPTELYFFVSGTAECVCEGEIFVKIELFFFLSFSRQHCPRH